MNESCTDGRRKQRFDIKIHYQFALKEIETTTTDLLGFLCCVTAWLANNNSCLNFYETVAEIHDHRRGALFTAIAFFGSLLNVVLRPYGGAYLALLTSLYPGYDSTSGLAGVIVGTLYSLIAGVVAGFVFGSLYNFFAERV